MCQKSLSKIMSKKTSMPLFPIACNPSDELSRLDLPHVHGTHWESLYLSHFFQKIQAVSSCKFSYSRLVLTSCQTAKFCKSAIVCLKLLKFWKQFTKVVLCFCLLNVYKKIALFITFCLMLKKGSLLCFWQTGHKVLV